MKRYFALFIACGFLFSCGSATDADKIGDAQMCIDNAVRNNSTDVTACTDKVADIDSPGADGIRCNADFVREGFADGSRLIKAFQDINGGTSGSNVQQMMGVLSFTSAGVLATDLADTQSAFNSCVNADFNGAATLASFSFFTMSLMKYFVAKAVASGDPTHCPATLTTDPSGYSYYDLSGCISNFTTDPVLALAYITPLIDSTAGNADADAVSVQSSIGAIIISTYGIACSSSGSNKNLCTLLSNAITTGGASNPRAVAVAFFSSGLGLP